MTLPPRRLWHTPHTLSSETTTLLFLPPLPPGVPSPSKREACEETTSLLRSPATIRASFTIEFAARMRPWKYDSSSATGMVVGMRFSVEDAGRREPCLESRSSAGGQFGVCG